MINCTFEDGGKGSLRHITVSAIVINDLGQVLLVKRAPHLTRPNTYTVPGGFLDRDETTEQAVLRELKEESGYNGEIVRLFCINDNPNRPKEDRQNVDFSYIVKVVDGEKSLNKEVTDITWFDQSNLPVDDDFAFDHREIILKYFEYLKTPFLLPINGDLLRMREGK